MLFAIVDLKIDSNKKSMMIIVITTTMMLMTMRTTMMNFIIFDFCLSRSKPPRKGKDKKFVCVVKALLISLVFFKQLLHQTVSFLYHFCGLSAAILTVCRYLGVFFHNAPKRSSATCSYLRLTSSKSLRQTE